MENNTNNSNNKTPNGLQREATPVRKPRPNPNGARPPQRQMQGQQVQKPRSIVQRQADEPSTPIEKEPEQSKEELALIEAKARKKKTIIISVSIILVLLISVPLIVLYIGDSIVKKDAVVVSLNSKIESLNEKISELEDAVADTTVQEVVKETSLQTVEGSLVPQFVTIDEKVIFPNKFELPNSNDDVNNSNIMVGSKFKFIPSNNWITKLQGATLQLSHPSHINGVLRSVAIKEVIKEEEVMKQIIQDFFVGFPATTINYRKVFLADKVAGMQGVANIEIDGKPSVVTIGFAQKSENALMYLFVYEEDNSAVQSELIDLFINSGSYGDSKIKLE